MYIPGLPKVLNGRSIIYLDKNHFTLDASGVAGFFGGAEAVSAMATVHICGNRKLLGWYNSPGSYEIAKHYGLITGFGFFFGGGHGDPAELLALFELDGQKGPPLLRVHSGTVIRETDHLAAVLMKECASGSLTPTEGSRRQPVQVTIAELGGCPENHTELGHIRTHCYSWLFAAIPIIISAGACAICAIIADWYSFSLILLGIIANGVSCLVIGSVKLHLKRPRLAGESDEEKPSGSGAKPPRVSGILISDTDIILLKGREDTAMAVAYGKFVLPPPSGRPYHRRIGWCAVLLLIQFVVQLLLIPQGTLFGQIMSVTSLAVSWGYNLWLCSLDKVKIQQKLLQRILELGEDDVKDYWLDSWPAMVVFVLLTLVFEDEEINEDELKTVLDELVEDTGEVWGIWKSVVLEPLLDLMGPELASVSEDVFDAMVKALQVKVGQTDGFSAGNRHALLKEARSGVETFKTRGHLRLVYDA